MHLTSLFQIWYYNLVCSQVIVVHSNWFKGNLFKLWVVEVSHSIRKMNESIRIFLNQWCTISRLFKRLAQTFPILRWSENLLGRIKLHNILSAPHHISYCWVRCLKLTVTLTCKIRWSIIIVACPVNYQNQWNWEIA